MYSSLVVALDLETVGDQALPAAASLAALGSLDVELVTVASPRLPEDPDVDELERRAARYELDRCTMTVLHDDDPGPALVAHLAERPDALLVMGTNAKGPVSSLLLGSVSEYVLARAGVPVLVIGPHASGCELVAPTLIAGVGEADRTDVIVPAIRRWAETFATSRTWVVHVREAPAVAAGNEDERRADANVHRLVEALRAEGVDALGKTVSNGDPATGLAEYGLIVVDPLLVAVSARWADVHPHRRSITRKLVRHSHRPVLVVPAAASAEPRHGP